MNTNTRRINTTVFPDPLFIGFDKMFDKLAAATPGQTNNNYPPYNIVKTEEYKYELQLAIAGFASDDLDIELKDGVLQIEGKKEVEDKNYLHRGISARSFRRTFTLADTVIVKGADLKDGILTINLENIIPEEKKPHKIAIGNGKQEFLTE